MKFLSLAILYFDLYGSPVSLLQKKREQYNTILGSIASLLIIIFTAISFINMTIDMLAKQSPNVISSIDQIPNPEGYILTPNNFMIGIAVGDRNGLPIINLPNKTIFRPTVKYCTQKTILDNSTNPPKPKVLLNCISYSMNICNKMKVNKEFLQVRIYNFIYFKKELQLTDKQSGFAYCINDTEWNANKITIQGTSTSTVFSYPVLSVEKCVNNTNDSSCAPQEMVNNVMSGGYFAIFITDRLLDQQKAGANPYRAINKVNLFQFRNTTQKYISYYFRHSYIYTRENFFYYFGKTYSSHVLQFDNLFESSNPISDNELLHATIFLDDKQITYHRSYDNFLNILGSISGLFELLVFLSGLILKPITKLSSNISLVNSIFSFENSARQMNMSFVGKKPQDVSVYPDKSTMFIRQSTVRSVRKLMENQQEGKSIGSRKMSLREQREAKVLKNFLSQKEKKFSLDGLEKLTVFCGGQKRKQMEYGLSKIDQKLDITFIIRKLIEIDKLKMLLLSSEQFKLFEYLPKPTIPLQTDKIRNNTTDLYFSEEKSFEVKVQEALEAYKISRDNKDELNQRLLQLMDNEVKDMFDQAIEMDTSHIQNSRNQHSKIEGHSEDQQKSNYITQKIDQSQLIVDLDQILAQS